MRTNLPPPTDYDSATGTKLFFDSYGQAPLEFGANEVNSTVAFFQEKGFDTDAAAVTASVLIKQARIDNIPIFQVLDGIKNFDTVKLSALVTEILNNNRSITSTLGYKTVDVSNTLVSRNILP